MKKRFLSLNLGSAAKGFTLVELLAVVAIIGILMVVALPAYNNYSTKSKFSEVVLATAPTKTAISTCAVSGDCVSGGAISLIATTIAGSSSPVADRSQEPLPEATASTDPQTAFDQLYAFYTAYEDGRYGSAAAAASNGYTTNWLITNAQGVQKQGYTLTNCTATQECLFTPAGVKSTSITVAAFSSAYAAVLAAPSQSGIPTPPVVSIPSSYTLQSLPCVDTSTTGCSPSTKYVATVSYDPTGIITATAQATSGLNAETFVLIPALSGGRVDWFPSGTCKTRAGGALC